MVAKSYQNWNQISKPFIENKKMYIMVEKPAGGEKKVRWYTDKEYRKMYPDAPVDMEAELESKKKALGYIDGYVWVFDNFDIEDEYMNKSIARYATSCGWYIPSNMTVPDNAPKTRKFYWEDRK